ncbi:substrate-binding domain-containing protein [Desulfovibrio sp. SGI.169]|uniref:substrate-binding domain-containing protein n=1 Tax=Desulfovibrio sp. SGI.169 TaxID=3420561 RepID=UPI003D04684A
MNRLGKYLLASLVLGVMALSGGFAKAADITVLSREDGSGTRGAFIELFKMEGKVNGKKVDLTTDSAEITNSTSVMMASVAGNKNAIGYISLGSLNDSVKALAIDGTKPSADAIKNGGYKICRPFNLVLSARAGNTAQDFLGFILSKEGQAVVEKAGYIGVGQPKPYAGSRPAGKIVAAGSSSVTPSMEKLKEAYLKVNPNAIIEIQLSDSTTGMNAARDGICDIGMASRELKDSELKAGLKPVVMAMDGIAIIVNKTNPVDGLTSEQVKNVFTGVVTDWSALTGK